MKRFKDVLREVNIVVEEVLAFDIILTSVLIFLVVYLALMLFGFNPWYSLFPTLGYFLFLLYIDLNTNKYKIVEAKYAPLYEKLRTAADNVRVESEIVDELQGEVVRDLHNVRVSSFVKIKRVSYKVLGSIIFCLLILFASIYNVGFGDFSFALDKAKDVFLAYREGTGDGDEIGDEFIAGMGGEEDIYGEDGVAKIGSREMEIKIMQASVEMIGGDVYEAPEREFEETFPDEVFADASGSYEERITLENRKIIKDYFKEISKG